MKNPSAECIMCYAIQAYRFHYKGDEFLLDSIDAVKHLYVLCLCRHQLPNQTSIFASKTRHHPKSSVLRSQGIRWCFGLQVDNSRASWRSRPSSLRVLASACKLQRWQSDCLRWRRRSQQRNCDCLRLQTAREHLVHRWKCDAEIKDGMETGI